METHFKHVYFVYEKHEVSAVILPIHSAHVQNGKPLIIRSFHNVGVTLDAAQDRRLKPCRI